PLPEPVLAPITLEVHKDVQQETTHEIINNPIEINKTDYVPRGNPLTTSFSPMGTGAEGGELARARAIAQRLGITNLTDDEYDIPTYLRRQQQEKEI
ncbi:MAG: hypothetical protein HY072_05000, partial [Deltaproteobacteria bacterium]|nr:hypothetical protein [Deltaproteobacteria bacterium]